MGRKPVLRQEEMVVQENRYRRTPGSNDNRVIGELESVSNWKNLGVIHQLASATMIEYCPLPGQRNPE